MGRRLCAEDNYPSPLLAVAGWELPTAHRTFPDDPLGDEGWADLLSAARAHRLTGLLWAAIGGGGMAATATQAEQARSVHRSTMLRVLSLEQELIAVVDVLAAAGIEVTVLKGTAVAHLDYRQPARRPFIDLDILVRPEDIDGAVRVLGGSGFVRTLAEPRPGFDRRFDKGTTLRSGAGFEIDLHRTFVLGPWGRAVDLACLWDGGQEFTVAGRPLRALSSTNRFIHACYHAALGDWPLRLVSLRDVAEMLRVVQDGGTGVIRRATEWGVEAVVSAAVSDARRLLGIASSDPLSAWAECYVPSRQEVSRLALHTNPDKTFAAQALATLRVLPGIRDKAAYLRALILPDAPYTAGRHPSALARFRFGIKEARRGRGTRG